MSDLHEITGQYVFDDVGNEHEVIEVDATSITFESSGGHVRTMSLLAFVAFEDSAEDRGQLEADDRLTCYTCKTWATSSHIDSLTHVHALERAADRLEQIESAFGA